MQSSKTVNEFLIGQTKWQAELEYLRNLLLSTELEETIKWGTPVYTLEGKNVVGLGAFKSYVGLWFHNGSFIDDHANVLHNANEGVTKALRQWRFNSLEEMNAALILSYIRQAIQNQKDGLAMKPIKNKPLIIPGEMEEYFLENPEIAKAFEHFTPGKKREFAEYVSEAKKTETRISRLHKIKHLIADGIGLNDKYRK